MMYRSADSLNLGRRLLSVATGLTAVTLLLAVGAFHISPVHAQQPAGRLEFDVASVKPSNPNSASGTVVNVTSGGRLHVVNATLKDLIETAYDVRSFQIEGGPKWADSTKFDVEATPGAPLEGTAIPKDWTSVRFEVQALLKDRFQLQLHRETKTAPVYSLTIAKGGVKSGVLSATQNQQRGINAGQGKMLGEAASMTQLAYKLSRLLQRPVVNNTGLNGNYDFKLEWTPDLNPSSPDGQSEDTSVGGSIFSAIREQLGLRLESTKGPVDVLVIDQVDRPSVN
jgi:bla regulator protein blaR1